jgi:RNA polymerase sigma-54 factor
VLPRLRVHEPTPRPCAARRRRPRRAGQRLQEARWFIRNIQQRFDTILRVADHRRAPELLHHGELAMRPLVLREIADELGLHESTISRVTTAKYMATPRGTFELKYFFGSALGTETGGNASSTAVRALIKQFVAAEDPRQPLSDSQLAEMLKEQGIGARAAPWPNTARRSRSRPRPAQALVFPWPASSSTSRAVLLSRPSCRSTSATSTRAGTWTTPSC